MNNLEEGPLPFWRVWGSKTLPKEHPKIHRKNGLPKRGPWGSQGRPREAQESPMRPNRSQKGPKRLPKEIPKSIILVFGQETSENVKIELPCRQELNFRGSNTFEIELFWCFLVSRISVEKGTRPRCLKIGSSGSLGAPREGPRAKMGSTRVPQGEPRGAQEAPKSSQNRGIFSNAPR